MAKSFKIRKGPNLEELTIMGLIGTRIISHLGSIGVGLYQGATGSTDGPLEIPYILPFAVSTLSGSGANIKVKADDRGYAQPIKDGTVGAIIGGANSVIELGASYFIAYGIGSFLR